MCGIAGIIRLRDTGAISADLEVMLGLMMRRGPDHSGSWTSGPIGLGHTRLSIIDLNPRAHQPFVVDERVVLTFNGEIYNFPSLKAELEVAGHSFQTTSDTEVVAKGFLEWGTEIFARLDGMFALGLVDLVNGLLYLARDPFGKKPLYLYTSSTEVIFSSDIRGIERVKRGSLNLNHDSIDYYLSELSMPQPRTIWREIVQVEPACFCQIDLGSLNARTQEYWRLPLGFDILEEEEALLKIEAALVRAVRKRTISDVPIGCFLSGGVDSGLVAAMLARQSSKRIKTFTVAIKGHPIDESGLARRVARRYDTEHTEIQVAAELEGVARDIIDFCGEPFADSSIIPSYLVSQAISQHLRVALSGDGGDELFGGYRDYQRAYSADIFLKGLRKKPFWRTRVTLDKLVSRLTGRANLGADEHYSRFTGAERLFRHMGFTRLEKDKLWRPELRSLIAPGENWMNEKWDESPSNWLSDQLMRASLSTRLLNDYLVKVDRASMFHSLEVRSPFLDRELAELSFRVSPEIKFKNRTTKYLLKRLAEALTDEHVFRREKRGFAIPLGEWLNSTSKRFVDALLEPRTAWIYTILDYSAVKRIRLRHLKDESATHGLWSFVCLELWAQSVGLGG